MFKEHKHIQIQEIIDTAARSRRPRVAMIGLRGIPNVEGGIEKHVEQLSLQLVKKGWDVEVFARRRYVRQPTVHAWQNIVIRPLWAPLSMRLETIVHTALSIISVVRSRPDLVHIHAIGPALLAPLARLCGLKVVVTHHGFDYDREKWRWLDKKILRFGEWVGMKAANGRIGVSQGVVRATEERCHVPIKFVPNAVAIEPDGENTAVLEQFGLVPKSYIVTVGRLVAEKRQDDLIAAFGKMTNRDCKLVIVGSGDPGSTYVRRLRDLASADPNVVLTGTQTGEDLATLYRNARIFALSSSHEGMPIVALEAMSFSLPVVMSDIPGNLELDLGDDSYFPVGDVDALSKLLDKHLNAPPDRNRAKRNIQRIRKNFGWSSVSDQTISIYRRVLGPQRMKMFDRKVHSKVEK